MFQAMYYATFLSSTPAAAPTAADFSGPITTIVNIVLRVLVGLLVSITGVRLLLASIAMSVAVGEEKMQKKDDLAKAIKAFAITVALLAAVLLGGKTVIPWISGMLPDASTGSTGSTGGGAILAGGSALVDWVTGAL